MKKIIGLLIVVLCIGYACMPTQEIQNKEINHVSALPGYDIDSLYKAFLECSKDEGDMGCDSCWQLIMEGRVDDSYWHDHQYGFHE